MGTGAVQIDVLGPIRARVGGTDVTPDGPLQRRLLALLVLRRGTTVSTDACADALWPADPPRDPAAALQTHLYRLRRSLPAGVIESSAAGYRLDPALIDLDADRLSSAVHVADVAAIESALDGWHGPAYPELLDHDDGRAESSRLDELRVAACEARAEVWLHGGSHDQLQGLAAELAALADAHPLRERPRALLIEVLAATGRRVDALRAYDDFRRHLADELGIEPSAALTARHAELLAGAGADGAAPDTWSPPNRLPIAVTSIVGRDALIAEALHLVDAHRLVTLLGTGGVGKTRLLLELGRLLREQDHAVVLCELGAVTEDSAVDAVAAALAVEGRPGVGLAERLVTVLSEAAVVLLLDNCEHVLDPIAALSESLLASCPGVRIVATTRERLRIAGEQLCPVPPLALRAPADESSAPAERLFLERARAVVAGFHPDDDERAVITDLVRRLDGLPLAIELAAARLHTMTVAEVLAGLDRRFHMLAAGSRTSVRHRSLGAAVEWSVGVLDDDLRRVFADVAVFAGPFTFDAAAAVCDRPASDTHELADALAELTERSLVMRAPSGAHVLLETMRDYGVELLEREGRLEEVRGRHARYWVDWTTAANRDAAAPGGEDVMFSIDDVLPELRAALGTLLDPLGGQQDVERAGRLVFDLQHYGFLRLRPDVLGWSERVVAADPDDTSPLAASVRAITGLAAWMAGDVTRYGAIVEHARALAGDAGIATVSTGEGNIDLFAGRLDEAAVHYRRAVVEAGDDRGVRLVNQCCVVLCLGYAGSPEAPAQAHALLAEIGDDQTPFAPYCWYCAGEAELEGDIDCARSRYERALELAERTGVTFVTGVAGASKASLELRHGDPAVAAAEYRELLLHWRRGGMWSMQWTMLRSVALLLDKLGRHRDAAVLVGALHATESGHRIFGADLVALQALDARLREALSERDYDEAVADGAALDDNGAVDLSLRALSL